MFLGGVGVGVGVRVRDCVRVDVVGGVPDRGTGQDIGGGYTSLTGRVPWVLATLARAAA